jgi:hypothetical protein
MLLTRAEIGLGPVGPIPTCSNVKRPLLKTETKQARAKCYACFAFSQ